MNLQSKKGRTSFCYSRQMFPQNVHGQCVKVSVRIDYSTHMYWRLKKRNWRFGSDRKRGRVTQYTHHRTSFTWPSVSAGGHTHTDTEMLCLLCINTFIQVMTTTSLPSSPSACVCACVCVCVPLMVVSCMFVLCVCVLMHLCVFTALSGVQPPFMESDSITKLDGLSKGSTEGS